MNVALQSVRQSGTPETSTIPAPAAFADRVSVLVDGIADRAPQAEVERKVPDETIEAFRASELQRLLQPKRYGGWEASFDPLVDISIPIARHCASSAWVLGLYVVHTWLAGLFPGDAQDEIWSETPRALIAGSYAPAGKAEAVDGGYRLSGRVAFSSGAPAADWLLCGAMVPCGPEGALLPAFTIVPKRDVTIDWESWDTVGLSGTGSYDVLLDDVFIPTHRVLTFPAAASGAPPGSDVNDDPMYRMTLLSCVPYSLALPSVGAAMGAVDRFVDENRVRDTRGAVVSGGSKVAGFQTVQKRVGEASAILDACILVARRDIREAHETVERDGALSVDFRMRNRRSQAFLAQQAKQAISLIMDAAGGRCIQRSHPIQRAWRDIQAVNAHISLNFDAVMSMHAQHRFGLQPVGQF